MCPASKSPYTRKICQEEYEAWQMKLCKLKNTGMEVHYMHITYPRRWQATGLFSSQASLFL